MKTNKKTIAQYAHLYALVIWGVLSLLYIAGEPIDEDMPFGTFCFLKLIGWGSLGLCFYVGVLFDRAGMLPDMDDDNDCEI